MNEAKYNEAMAILEAIRAEIIKATYAIGAKNVAAIAK